MIFARVRAERGHCYENALAFMIANAIFVESHKLHYVQGVVTTTNPGHERIGHCWVELTDPETGLEYVLEPVDHGVILKSTYYAKGQVSNTHRYEFERMLKIAAESDSIGPWTDDVRDALHTGEVAAPKHDQELVQNAKKLGIPAFEIE